MGTQMDHSPRKGHAAVVADHSGNDHLYHIVSQRKYDPFHDAPQMHEAKRRRPHPRNAEDRQNAIVAQKFLKKLEEKGKTLSEAFILLDGDRDGILTGQDIKTGVMSRLGFQVPKNEME